MAFEFGMFHEFHRPPGTSQEAAFDESFRQIDAAERWGLDAMWLAELHTAPERSVLAAPMTIASAIAARTKHIKIGTAVQVLPLCHPLRLAEEAATVDQISKGRLIFGVGRSGFPRVYQAYGINYGESRERFAETLQILKQAWTEPSFSYKGKYYSFDNVKVSPKPYQKPWPEIRIGGGDVGFELCERALAHRDPNAMAQLGDAREGYLDIVEAVVLAGSRCARPRKSDGRG